MQSRHTFRTGILCCLLTTVLVATLSAIASNGREFSGYYDLSAVSEQGDLMQFTLHLRLFNHGGADAKNVVVLLMEASPAPTLRGNFQPVKTWKAGQFIEMSQQFTISKREFSEWTTRPVQPNVVILFQDKNGKTWQRGAQISRAPLFPVTP